MLLVPACDAGSFSRPPSARGTRRTAEAHEVANGREPGVGGWPKAAPVPLPCTRPGQLRAGHRAEIETTPSVRDGRDQADAPCRAYRTGEVMVITGCGGFLRPPPLLAAGARAGCGSRDYPTLEAWNCRNISPTGKPPTTR